MMPPPRRLRLPSRALCAALPLCLLASAAAAQRPAARPAPLLGVAFTRDGRLAAVLDTTGRIRVSERPSGRVLRTVDAGHRRPITSYAYAAPIALSGDGRLLAAGSNDGRVRVWEVATGRLLSTLDQGVRGMEKAVIDSAGRPNGRWTLTTDMPITGVAFSPDGMSIASVAADRSIVVRGVHGAPHADHHLRQSCSPYGIDFSDDGNTLAVACGRGELVSLRSGARLPVDPIAGPAWDPQADEATNSRRACTATAVRFSPGGGLLAVLCSASGEVRTYAAATGERMWTGSVAGSLGNLASGALAFSADGRRVAAATGEGVVAVWGASRGELREARRASDRSVLALWLSSDGRRVVFLPRWSAALRTRALDGG